MRRQPRHAQRLLFDLGRKHIDPAQDHHVVGTPGDLLHPAHRARRAGKQPRQIARAVADHRQALLGERGEHQFPLLAVRQHPPRRGIDDLGIEMVLPDMQPVLGLDALVGDARPHDFRKPVDIDRMHVESLFDLRPHGVGPGLGAENADRQRRRARIDALTAELVENREHVTRRHHDDARLEIDDQPHLPLGHAARDRHDRAAQFLGAVVRAEASRKQAVAVGDMQDVAGPPARGADRARNQRRPPIDIALRIADDGRFAGRARGRMQPHDLLARNREQAERIGVAQIALFAEREFGEVFEPLAVGRVDAGRVEFRPRRRHIRVGVVQRPL